MQEAAKPSPFDSDAFAQASREARLIVDEAGRVQAIDKVGQRLLCLEVGASLLESAERLGSAGKLKSLLKIAQQETAPPWDLALLGAGKPLNCEVSAWPAGVGRIALLARLIPHNTRRAIIQMSDAVQDVVSLNHEIAQQKDALRDLNQQLTESNQGVVALHHELQDKAREAVATSEIRNRIVANVSHEFRTPIHSILGLSKLLLSEAEGPLATEQKTQLTFIRTAAEELSLLVNDVLDLSKLESGRAQLRSETFSAAELLSTLRGMLLPVLPDPNVVKANFEIPDETIMLETDRGKLSQILRNFIANAAKFTIAGEIHVYVKREGHKVAFSVRDTGIGIRAEDHAKVFEEFVQLDTPLEHKGAGLGLSLSKQLAQFLGGEVSLQSELGRGSTFTVTIPAVHKEVARVDEIRSRQPIFDPKRSTVLVLEDDRRSLILYDRFLSLAGFQVAVARTVEEAWETLRTVRPAAMVLDVMLDGETSWKFLQRVKTDPTTRDIPVMMVTVTNREQKARALGADEFWLKPIDQDRLIRKLQGLARDAVPSRVLLIDDNKQARYLVTRFLANTSFGVLEAETGHQGLEVARREHPDVILLDFVLPDMTGLDVLDELKADPQTRQIPVVIVTSHQLTGEELRRLSEQSETILTKDKLTRELAISRIRDALAKVGVHPTSAPNSNEYA